MLKNLKKVAAIVLSFAMAVQFGLADSYYVNAVEEPVEPQQEETTTTAPQEQEEVPTAEEETPQQQEEQQQPAVEEEQPAPETKSVELSYVAEDGTVLHETASRDFNLDYSLNTDSSVMLNFDGYTLKDVIINNSQTVPADQANLSVTSDLVSVKFVYVSVNTKEDKQTSENNEQTKTEEANEDDAEADPETKEELPEYPAFDQSETAGNVVVHATAAEGVLPRDSKLVVKRITRKAILNAVEDTVSEKNKEMDSAVALDITIQNKDGVEIQPNGSVNISFENAAVSGDEINVYHVTDDASAVTEVATNTQSFDANHFSIYVITGEKEKPLTTFNFVANGNIVSKQIVKTGDELITPTAPDVAGKAFVGWYDGETKFEDFNTALTITETTTRTITAKYEDALYIYFYNPDGTQIMRTEKVGNHDARNFTDVSYDVDSTHKLVGWAAERNGTKNIAGSIAVPKGSTSVNVYAIIKEGYWISFDSDGGSIVDSQFVLNGDKLTLNKSTNPTKPGYTFDGWYNGSAKVENGATVTNPMTLKAHWNAAEVNYTINYWQQKVTDDKNATDAQKTYEYVEAETKKATTGTPISAENLKTYKGFKYNANNSSKNVEISGDGTTIINVYYDRVLCTVNFYVDKGYYWSDWQISKTVTGLYGANLPKGAWDTSTYSWKSRKSDGSGCVLLTSFDFETAGYAKNQGNVSEKGIVTTCNFYGSQQSGSGKINYYNEQADGSYVLAQSITTGNGTLTVHEKFAGYDLYKYSKGNVNGESAAYWNDLSSKYNVSDGDDIDHERNKPINIASKLKTYSLSYYNYNKVTKTEKSIKYTASLKSYANYTPAKPSELPSYYVFGGWYKDKACTTKFDFNTEKMPNANVQIYAKWTAKKINLTYNLNTPDGTSKKVNSDVDAGTIASTVLPSASEIEGYSFAGWYYADGNGNITKDVFNANDAILRDTNVIGKWLYNGKLTVKYVADGVEAPKDNNVYAGGAKATVANGVTKDGKKFLGWKLKGSLYYPGDAFEVNKNLANDDNVITLKAIWGNEESSTTMSYNPGNGRGSVQTVPVKNNASVTLKSENDFGYQAPEKEGKEYYFAGWATSKDDANNGKATYAAGQTVHVDVNGENVLYATWIEKTVITLVAKSNTVTYNGEAQSVEGFGDVADGYIVSGLTAKATGTNVGEYTTEIKGTAHVEKDNQDVTNKVIVNVVSGKLTISKRNVTLTSATDSKPYDGTALTNDKVTVGGQGFAEGQGATYNVTGTITNVGEKANAFEYSLNKGTKADNYNITKTEGTLKVTPVTDQVTVTITGNTGSVKYDGDSHEVTGYTTSFSNALYTANDFEFNGTAEASRTDAGQTNMGLAAEQFTNTSANFTNVEFVVTDGYSKVNKRTVTLTSASDEKVYDGNALTKKKVTESEDGFAKGEGATYDVTGSQTNVGSSKNTFTYTLNEGTNADNYEITKAEGTLKVTPITNQVTVTITGNTGSVKYDGHEKTVSGYDVTITAGSTYKTDDFTFSGTAEVKGTEAGTYSMGLNADQFTNTNDNYTQVTFIVNDGTLTITPKSITPDGPNTPEDKKTGITATNPDDSIYNGEAHVNPLTVRDTKTGKDLVENKDYTLTYSDDVVNVGTVTVTVKGIGNYTGEFTKKYQITPREYTVTTDSANKTYDGNPLTAGGTVNNLVKDETVVFTITGSQTNVGTSDNTYELKFEGTAKAKNYTHGKDSIGKLKVTKKSIVPDGPDTPDEKKTGIKVTKPDDTMYNGKEQKNKPVVRDTKRDVELVEDTDYTLSYTAAVNAGTVTVTITGIGNYEGTVNTSYEITPRKVIMTSADDTKVYDGNALTKNKVTESGNGFVEGEGATYDVTGSQTDVGFSNNTFSYKLNKGTLASNYTIETKEGKLEVTPFTDKVTVTITGEKDTAVYDGKTHSVEGYKVTNISNALYKKADVQFNGTAKAEGIEVGTYTMKLTPAQFENKSRNFANVEFVVNDGKLEITPKSIDSEDEKTGIKVTKPNDTMYNGEEQKNKPNVEDTKTGATLVENVDYTLSYTAAVNAGTVEVTITGKGNYTGTAKTSYEITKRDVLLTSATDSKVYDKKPLMNGKVTESGSGFVKDEGATYNVTGSQTKKGSSKNTFTYELKSNTKASNYTIEVVYGDLTVTAEDGEVVVVITGHKKSFEYDGNEKSVKGYDVSITKGSTYEVSDFTFNGNDEVKGTEANSYPMGLKASDFINNNDNYNKVKFVVTDGSLTITPKSITPDGPNTPEEKKTGITATDPEDSIYTGKAHVNPLTVRDTKTNKDLVENKDYTLTYSDDVVNVGTVTVTVKGIGNYTGEFTKTYKITPREYTVTTDSAKKTYDGTALTAGGHVNGLVEGETVSFKTTGSQTNEGTSDNTYELKFEGTAVETNYKHGKDSIGTLTVKKQSIDPGEDPEKPNPNYLGIEISNPSDEVYDGKEHKWSPTVVDKTGKELIVGTDYAVEYATSDFTNAGTINVTITGIGNYTGKVTRTYSITPREYTITTLDGTKVYDGKALTNFGLVDGIVYGETYSFKTTGSQTEVGTSDNTYEWKWNGTAKKSNYKLAKESIGKLTVKAKSIVPDGPDTPNEKKTGITVNEPSDSKYDGKEHKEVLTVTDTKTGKELVAGTDYSVTYSSDLVNAGTVTIKVAGLGNYTGSFTKTYKITKRSVTLTSATVSKVYDGSALTNTSITVSGDGFVEGEGASYEVTGTQTEVGNSANAFEYKLNENTLASNYNITKVVGTLTITAAPAPVTPATPSTPSSTPSTTPRTPSAPQVTTPVETVEKETTPKAEPKKEEKVEEEYTPKASPQYYWALINLICAILTVLFGLLLLISKRHKSEDDDEEDDDETKQQTTDDDEDKEQEKKRGLFTRVLAVLIAIVSVVFFLVTEDLSLPWTWTDQWTIWMVVIGLVQIVVFFVGRKWKNVDNDDDDEEAQQA